MHKAKGIVTYYRSKPVKIEAGRPLGGFRWSIRLWDYKKLFFMLLLVYVQLQVVQNVGTYLLRCVCLHPTAHDQQMKEEEEEEDWRRLSPYYYFTL